MNKYNKLTLEQRQRLWSKADQELEEFCRSPVEIYDRPVVVDVPDAWQVALGYVAEEDRRRSRKSRQKRGTKSPKPKRPPAQRLASDDVADLVFYWGEWEAAVGLRSSWHEQAEAMDECAECGFRFEAKSRKTKCPGCGHLRGQTHMNSLIRCHSGQGSAWHPSYDTEILGVVTSREMDRANRVRDVLVEMVDRGFSFQVAVLFRAYGDLNRYSPFGVFGDVAQVVTMTGMAGTLAKKFNLPERDAIERRLRMAGADKAIESLKAAAEKLLIDAADKYRACK